MGEDKRIDEDLESPVPATSDSAEPTKEKAMTKPFPEDAQKRKGIVVLSQSEIDRCRYEDGGSALLLNEEIHVLEFPVRDSQKIIQDILDRGLVRRGAVLVQSPFDRDRYEDAAQAKELFALAKHMHFSAFCMRLGAREVSIEQIQLSKASETRTWSVEGDAKIKRVGAAIDTLVKQDELDAFRSQLTLVDTFEGGQADLKAAEELLRRTNLLGDPNMAGLLDIRQSGSNQLRSRTLTLNLSSETKRNLSVIGKLTAKLPPFIEIELEADYKRAVREQSEYTLTVKVRF